MKRSKKTPVFFIATKVKEHPITVSFYTHTGKKVNDNKVTKTESNKGTAYFATL